MTSPHFTLSGLTAVQLRWALESLLIEEHELDNVNPPTSFILRPLGHDGFVHVLCETALRLLPFAQLIQCFADHRPQIIELLYAQVDLHRQGVSLVPDHQGTEWLAFDDRCVDLPADDACHVVLPAKAPKLPSPTPDSQGGQS